MRLRPFDATQCVRPFPFLFVLLLCINTMGSATSPEQQHSIEQTANTANVTLPRVLLTARAECLGCGAPSQGLTESGMNNIVHTKDSRQSLDVLAQPRQLVARDLSSGGDHANTWFARTLRNGEGTVGAQQVFTRSTPFLVNVLDGPTALVLATSSVDATLHAGADDTYSMLGNDLGSHGTNLWLGSWNYGVGSAAGADGYKFYEATQKNFETTADTSIGKKAQLRNSVSESAICVSYQDPPNSAVRCHVLNNTDSSTNSWQQMDMLNSSSPLRRITRGVATHGDRLVVSALDVFNLGALLTYTRSGVTWRYESTISDPDPSTTTTSGEFGRCLAMGHNVIFAGTPVHVSSPNGRVDMFVWSANTWTHAGVIASTGSSAQGLGWSMSLHSNRLVIGAPGADTGTVVGSVHVYDYSTAAGTVSRVCSFRDSSSHTQFGVSVAHEMKHGHTTVIVGAPRLSIVKIMSISTAGVCQWDRVFDSYSMLGRVALDPAHKLGLAVAFAYQYAYVGAPFFDSDQKIDAGFVGVAAYCFPNYQILTSNVVPVCRPCALGYYSSGGRVLSGCRACSPKPSESYWVEGLGCNYVCNQHRYGTNCDQFNCTAYMAPGLLPANAFWEFDQNVFAATSACTWRCFDGYYNDTATSCAECPGNVKPANAKYVDSACSWQCLTGYFNHTRCVVCSTHMAAQALPLGANSHWVDGQPTCYSECDPGYEQVGSACQPCAGTIPSQSTYDHTGCNYTCNTGYFGPSCTVCSVYQASLNPPDYVLRDEHSSWVDGVATCDWGCASGYVRSDAYGGCCPQGAVANSLVNNSRPYSCNLQCVSNYGWNITTSSCDTCELLQFTKPTQSSWTVDCAYTCNANYFGTDCTVCSTFKASDTSLPAKAQWVDNLPTCDWDCIAGFQIPVNLPGQCCPDPGTNPPANSWFDANNASWATCNYRCDPNYQWNATTFSCDYCGTNAGPAPPHASWDSTSCSHACDIGYFGESDPLTCVDCATCASTECLSGQSWVRPADNYHWVEGNRTCFWQCDAGYTSHLAGTGFTPKCCPDKPAGSTYLGATCDWACTAQDNKYTTIDGLRCEACEHSDTFHTTTKPTFGSKWTSVNGRCIWLCDTDNGWVQVTQDNDITSSLSQSTGYCCEPPDDPTSSFEWTSDKRCIEKNALSQLCAQVQDCGSCVGVQNAIGQRCGWCPNTEKCVPGVQACVGVDTTSVSILTATSQCVAQTLTRCSEKQSCSSCTAGGGCAWCTSKTPQCVDAASKSCSKKVSRCTDECRFDDCNECIATEKCGWCDEFKLCSVLGTTNSCQEWSSAYDGGCSNTGIWLIGIICGAVSAIVVGAMCCCFVLRVRGQNDPQRRNDFEMTFEMAQLQQGQQGGQNSENGPEEDNGRGLPTAILATFPTFQYAPNFTVTPAFTVSANFQNGREITAADTPQTDNPEEPPTCSICLGDFTDGEDIRMLPCLHMFHLTCIDKWFDVSRECPLCKRNLFRPEPAVAGTVPGQTDLSNAGFASRQLDIAAMGGSRALGGETAPI